MAIPSPSRFSSASPPLRFTPAEPSFRNLGLLGGLKAHKFAGRRQCEIGRALVQGWSQRNVRITHGSFHDKPSTMFKNSKPDFACAVNMAEGQSDEPENLRFQHLMDKARESWDSSPEPVKSFPWNRALENFIQLILDLTLAVVKILCAPLLAITSLSEMSYCAHEKKLSLVPFPLVIGFALAGVLKETALELSPLIKEAKAPWHLIAIAIFFTLIKFPGPYYPYWGRIFIPHVANGALLRTLWSAYVWYRRSHKASP